jgi:mannose-6-phosphate isomerase-like protein (cupin superfamily)
MYPSTVNNLYKLIAATELDPEVGIRVGHLSGSEQFSFFGAEIGPQKVLSAHYHNSGDEIYLIIEGSGSMYLGELGGSGNVVWEPPFNINKGDCFTVGAGTVHQLCNNTDQKLIALFGCSKSHLSTDRVILKGHDN